jgi:hypothetical protein
LRSTVIEETHVAVWCCAGASALVDGGARVLGGVGELSAVGESGSGTIGECGLGEIAGD